MINMWYLEQTTYDLFLSGALGAMKTAGKIATDITDKYHELIMVALMAWRPDNKIHEYPEFPNAVDALQSFTTWVSSWEGPRIRMAADKLTITMTVPYGKGGMVTFGAEAHVPLETDSMSHSELGDFYRAMFETVKTGYSQMLSLGKAGDTPMFQQQQQQQQQQQTETFDAGLLVYSVQDGKKSFKVKGGRYLQWGVAIYPEAMKASGFDPALINENIPLTGYKAIALVGSDGKARKVIELRKE